MTKRKYTVLFLLFCFQLFAQSNDSLNVNFKVVFDRFPLELNKRYVSTKKDTITVTAFKCYVSDLEIQFADKTVFKEKNSHHLLDLANPSSLQIPITKNSDKIISKVTFNIGIDSTTNTSGALGGDLDPIQGMYWAWQSGYVNMKIEGQSPSCKTRKNQFEFHLGGYLQPYNAMRKKVININNKSDISISIDVSVFFAEVTLATTNSVMIPGKIAMELADLSSKMFYSE
ncbi:MbnP family protein [Flavobacterium sedimenticola]|uniref:Copper-binding protein MbnP-like domain-containing protein n=1 Tax=Flavobacterium sedimenticola TaxID=3043286 RepID=A0ABT6XTE9_9FLAO|nr:MbnP family protein [Flavobacterium sedimenticola]MDI9258350.1 hypothetical protein [Flavobacterium sedimenticola]